MTLHEIILFIHSTFRWVVLAFACFVLVKAIGGARAKSSFSEADEKRLEIFARVFDVQVLLGLFMYFATSALGVRMFAHAKEAMKVATLRFFMLEHAFGMLTAIAVLHIGLARLKRRGAAPSRHRATAILVGIVLAIIFATIPWPFFPYARPLLRVSEARGLKPEAPLYCRRIRTGTRRIAVFPSSRTSISPSMVYLPVV